MDFPGVPQFDGLIYPNPDVALGVGVVDREIDVRGQEAAGPENPYVYRRKYYVHWKQTMRVVWNH